MAEAAPASQTFPSIFWSTCIVRKATEYRLSILREIAKVNKTLMQVTRRCSQTLVIHCALRAEDEAGELENLTMAFPKAAQKQPPERSPCKALLKELTLRPSVHKLVIERDASGVFWPILSSVEWTSANVALPERLTRVLFEFLATSRRSLRRFKLDPGPYYPGCLDSGIRAIAQAFPQVDNLTLRGGELGQLAYGEFLFAAKSSDSKTGFEVSKLSHVDVADHVLPKCFSSSQIAPVEITALLSLRCASYAIPRWFYPSLFSRSRPTRLQTIDLDVWTDALPDSMLQTIAFQCPSLRFLFLHAAPSSTTAITALSNERLEVAPALKKCPMLQRLAISQPGWLDSTIMLLQSGTAKSPPPQVPRATVR